MYRKNSHYSDNSSYSQPFNKYKKPWKYSKYSTLAEESVRKRGPYEEEEYRSVRRNSREYYPKKLFKRNNYEQERPSRDRSPTRSRSRSYESRHRVSCDKQETEFRHKYNKVPYHKKIEDERFAKSRPPWRNSKYDKTHIHKAQDLREILRGREETKSPRHEEDSIHVSNSEEIFEHNDDDDERQEVGSNYSDSWVNSNDINLSLQEQNDKSSYTSKCVIDDIPMFDGSQHDVTAKQFLSVIDFVGDKFGWKSDDRKCQMASRLCGSAKDWLMKHDFMSEQWDRLKSDFLKAYPTEMDFYDMLKKMMDRNKLDHESLNNYFTFKTVLMDAVGITGRRAVSCLIGGLAGQQMQEICYEKNFATPDELFEYLVGIEEQIHLPQSSNSKCDSANTEEWKVKLIKHASSTMGSCYEEKHFVTVEICKNILSAYNDLSAGCVTIKEESANLISLPYIKRRTTVIGFRGVPVMALGDCKIKIAVDKVDILSNVFVVPNISQEQPVIIGKSFRDNEKIKYVEYSNSIAFNKQ